MLRLFSIAGYSGDIAAMKKVTDKALVYHK